MGFFSKGLKNKFETAVVNEPSVLEPLKFYCILFPSFLKWWSPEVAASDSVPIGDGNLFTQKTEFHCMQPLISPPIVMLGMKYCSKGRKFTSHPGQAWACKMNIMYFIV